MTFSIVARCARSECFGVGAVTALPAVGKLVSYAWPLVGAAATQARVNPYLGIDAIRLMRDRLSAREALERLARADPRVQARQFALVDGSGETAAWTGEECLDWAGHDERDGFTVQGNRLVGPDVVREAADAFERTDGQPLPGRLLAALEAGIAAGGDRLGERSGSVLVVEREEYPVWDIRVDDHPDPAAELRRLHAVFAERLVPHIRRMPTRREPAGSAEEQSI